MEPDKIIEIVIKVPDVKAVQKYMSGMATKYAMDGFKIVDIKEFPSCFVITFEG